MKKLGVFTKINHYNLNQRTINWGNVWLKNISKTVFLIRFWHFIVSKIEYRIGFNIWVELHT